MRVSRLFVDQPLTPGACIELSEASSHYLSRVLRLQRGATLIAFNGKGCSYQAQINEVSKKSVLIGIEDQLETSPQQALQVHLGIGLSKGDRFDSVIQKATELGVGQITPLFSERCEVRLNDERLTKKQLHWQQIAVSACEQSGQNWLPAVNAAMPLGNWIDERQETVRLALHPDSQNRFQAKQKPTTLALLVGPEGGFSETEMEQATSRGFTSWQLGPRILRTETAPLAALSIIQFLWGDLS